ncbi:MAG TPA: nitronate monooxygenase [Candidatus Cybelea sp.]|nr:nitronate monooxygenase [Candidatus Cybelea sp.]
MWHETQLSKRLGLKWPIIQAPMASVTTPALACAASNAGALGSLGGAMSSPAQIEAMVAEVRAGTNRAFNVNLFVLDPPKPDRAEMIAANAKLKPMRDALGLAEPPLPTKFGQSYPEQAEALLAAHVPVASFTFGLPDAKLIARFRSAGTLTIGTATTAAEARALVANGIEVVCAQGVEAGGHRGSFLADFEDSAIGTMALVPQIVDAVNVPVIAAGGIMDGRGIAAALMLGAQAVQLGTAFLRCPEASVHPVHRQRLAQARDDGTRLTRAFTGRPARSLTNRFVREMSAYQSSFPAMPVQGALTADIRQAAIKAGDAEFMTLWSGQGASLGREMPASELIATLASETERVLGGQTMVSSNR